MIGSMNSLPLPALGMLASPIVAPGGSAPASFDALLASAQPVAPQSGDALPVQGDVALAMPAQKLSIGTALPKPLKMAEQILSAMPESRAALTAARFALAQPVPVSAKALPAPSADDAIAEAVPLETNAPVALSSPSPTLPAGGVAPSPVAAAEPALPALVTAGEQGVTATDEAEPEAIEAADGAVRSSMAARDLPRPKPLAVRTSRSGAPDTPQTTKPTADAGTPADTMSPPAEPAPMPVLPEVIIPLPAAMAAAPAPLNAPLPEASAKAALSLPAQAPVRSGADQTNPPGLSRARASEAAASTEAQLVVSATAPHKLKAGQAAFVLPGADAAQPSVTQVASAPVRPAEAAAPNIDQRALDLARGDQWLQQLASDIVSVGQRDNRLSFRLMPRTLGQLDVELSHSDAGLSISMNAVHEDARAILSDAQPRLVEDIRAQGVRVADARVSSGGADQQQNRSATHQWEPQIEFARDAPVHSQTPEEERRSGRFA